MQSTHMASQQIREEEVYLCTGNPLPKDIEQISYWLLNESFAKSFKRTQPSYLLSYCRLVIYSMPLFLFVCLFYILFNIIVMYLIHCRNIWCQKKERIGLGRYCKRSDNVSAMHSLCYMFILHFVSLILSAPYYLSRFVFKIKMPSDVRVQLINDMAEIEYAPTCSLSPCYSRSFLLHK